MNEVKRPRKPLMFYYAIVLLALILFNALVMPFLTNPGVQEIDYSEFMKMTEDKKIAEVMIEDNKIIFKSTDGNFYKTGLVNDPDLTERLYQSGARFESQIVEQMSPLLSILLSWVLPMVLIIGVGQYFSKKLMENAGGGAGSMMFGMGKSNAKVYVKSTSGIKFDDVAGEDEAKEILSEIVDFLENPKKYEAIGAKMPKGALLVGPPGTGKTLLAKAVAGEANVPFFSISGSEFVEMFVGMGAAKVRDLFKQANEKAPCIVFIDEVDAIGGKRDGRIGGNDEREQTLNQLLVEMDGFTNNEGVIVMAATNRSDILDPALLRPGRFDRRIVVNYPDVKGREEILKVHSRNKPLAPDVDLAVLARRTPYFTGADLMNVMNEAALLTARKGLEQIDMSAIEEAITRVMAGPEKKSRKVTEMDRKLVAYHEGGHAIVAHYIPECDDVHEITTIPRGSAGGYTMYLPQEEFHYVTTARMKAQMASAMGGRVAEALVFGDVTTGASSDIKQATEIARSMVTEYGMSSKLGPVYLGTEHEVFLGKSFSQQNSGFSEMVNEDIDGEVHKLLQEAYDRAKSILSEHIDQLHGLAKLLIEKEKIDKNEFLSFMNAPAEKAIETTFAEDAEAPAEALPAAEEPAPEETEE
ncbi:MAG: ATP-dependent zinc metalloprotease FtsH [Clostridia bacterium]|nr:ATP-dependent zinc metalloprotease FtsH [Clostridia bacterium]